LHVPYRGVTPVVNALLTGEVDTAFDIDECQAKDRAVSFYNARAESGRGKY